MTTTQTTERTIQIAISAERTKSFGAAVALVKGTGATFDGDDKVWTLTYDLATLGLSAAQVELLGEGMAVLDRLTADRAHYYAEYITITYVDAD